MNNSVGQTIAHYRIEKVLGQGGMGSAFLALDLQLKRRVAIKLMHPHLASNQEFQARFLQEAQAAAALDHPNIIRVFSADHWQGYLYMVMELVTGGSLRDYQRHLYDNGKILTLTQTISLISQVADALDYAHGQGMIHRDIKPDNVLLKPATGPSGDFRGIITDFGLAKLAEGGVHSMSGQVMGTLAYMSPEQCLGKEVDSRSDIYSLGIMLYELLVGKLPFAPKTITEAIHLHSQVPPPQIAEVRPGLPAALQRAVSRALAKNPAERYQYAAELAKDLGVVNNSQVDRQALTALDSKPNVDNITTYLQSKPIAFEKPAGPAVTAGEKDLLILTDPQGAQRTITLDRPSYRLGRSPENEIVLAHDSVSRSHARLELMPDRSGYNLTDLGSRNGTYIGEAKLLANIPEHWPSEEMVRIGDFRLQWQMGQERFRYSQQQSVQPVASFGTPATSQVTGPMPSGLQYQSGATAQPVAVTINPAQLNVQPGGSVTAQIDLLNQSMTVQHFMVRIQGIPEEWGVEPGTPIQLLPGARGQTSVTFSPPRLPTSTAGLHNFRVRVMSTQSGAEIASIGGGLRIQPFTELAADFQPKRLRKQGVARVYLTNNGNTPLGVTLAPRDREEALTFTPPVHQLTIQPGQSEEVTFAAVARKQVTFGSQQVFPFEISINTAGRSQQILTGDYVSLPRLPSWVAGVATFLCVACAIGAVALVAFVQNLVSNQQQTATAIAAAPPLTQTAVAVVQTQTAVIAAPPLTQTAAAVQAQAQTATALGWLTITAISQTQTAIAAAPPLTQTAAAVQAQAQTQTAGAPTATPNLPPGVCTGYPTSGNVNLRSGPGTAYDKVGLLSAGSFLVLIGKNPDSTWYVSNTGSGFVWVSAQFLTLNGPCDGVGPFPTPPPPTAPVTSTAVPTITPIVIASPTPTAPPPPTVITPTPPHIITTLIAVTLPIKPIITAILILPTATPAISPPLEPELQAVFNKVIPSTAKVIEAGYADVSGDGTHEYFVLTDPDQQFNLWIFGFKPFNKRTVDAWNVIFSQSWQIADPATDSVRYWLVDLNADGKLDFLVEAKIKGIMSAAGYTFVTNSDGNPAVQVIFGSGSLVKGVVLRVDKGYILARGFDRSGACIKVEWYWNASGKWDAKSGPDQGCG